MKYSHVLQSEDAFNPYHWHNNYLPECLTNDQLWGYMICVGEEMTEDYWGKMNDPVLTNLMCMGIFECADHREQCLNQTLPTIHHSTTIASRIIPCLKELETKVRVQSLYLNNN